MYRKINFSKSSLSNNFADFIILSFGFIVRVFNIQKDLVVNLRPGVIQVWHLQLLLAAVGEARAVRGGEVTSQLRLVFQVSFFRHFRLYNIFLKFWIFGLNFIWHLRFHTDLVWSFSDHVFVLVARALRIAINLLIIRRMDFFLAWDYLAPRHIYYWPRLLSFKTLKLHLAVHQAIMVERIERLVLHPIKALFARALAHVLLLVWKDLPELLLALWEDGAGGRLFHVLWRSFNCFLRVRTHKVILHVLRVVLVDFVN